MKRLFFLLIFIAGCNPLKPAQLELPTPPESYSHHQTGPVVQLSQHWWEDFDDPQLNRLQQQLFSNNLTLRQALYRLQQLEALQKISRSTLWPQLNLNGSLNREENPGVTSDTITTGERLSVAARYEVDLWNRLGDKTRAAELRREAGENDVKALLLSLSAQLTEQYFLAVEQQAHLKLLEQQTARKEQFLQIVTERYRGGLATASDVYSARQNLEIVKTLLPDRRTALTLAENNIAALLGQPPGTIAIKNHELPQLDNIIDIGLPADLLLNRPDITAALQQLEATDHELAAALADRLPAINLSASIGYSANQLAMGNVEGSLWSLALGLTQPLIDGGRRQAETERQKALRAEKLAIYQQTVLAALQEVETALAGEINATSKKTRLEQRQQINHKNLQLIQENYLYGLGDIRDLLLSQIMQLEILSQQVSNQRQLLSYRITLARALGGRWMEGEITRQQENLDKKQDRAK
jgi:NodT family efflux transporter outer membrane factor (OMF) lipoprotein